MKQKLLELLKKTEKYTQTNMVYLAKGGSVLMANGIVGALTSLVTSIALSNLLPRETFGTYKYILSFITLLHLTTLPGMSVAVARSVARGYEGGVRAALRAMMQWGTVGSLIGLGISTYYFMQGDLRLGSAFVVGSLLIPFFRNFRVYQNFLQGKKAFGASTRLQILVKIAICIGFVALLLMTNNVVVLVAGFMLLNAVTQYIAYRYTLRHYVENDKTEASMIGYGKHLSLMRLLGSAAQELDKLVIWHYLGPIQVAIYSIAYAPLNILGAPISQLGVLALPKFSTNSKESLKKTLPKKVFMASMISLLVILGYILLIPYAFRLIYPLYPEAIKITQILALGYVFQLRALFSQALEAQQYIKELYVSRTAVHLLRILLYFILGYYYGIWGIVATQIIADGFLYFAFWYILKKR
ncbi:oligosaccharide flippase family protein [Candidatus Nomurabacteria bacterium]|nr:oligosaccharide flippase family protein [Candidatus Nomurabacteria bacterium]